MDTLIIFGANDLIFAAMVVAAVVFWRLARPIQKDTLWLAILTLPTAFILSRLVSWLYFNPRPFVVGQFVPLIAHAADNGFPSDHTLLLSAVAMLFWRANRWASIGLWILVVLVGAARVAAGVHHPIDILGSMAISIVVAVSAVAVLKRAS